MTPATGRTLIFPVTPLDDGDTRSCRNVSFFLEKNQHSTFFVFTMMGDQIMKTCRSSALRECSVGQIGSLLGAMSIWQCNISDIETSPYRIVNKCQDDDDDDVNSK